MSTPFSFLGIPSAMLATAESTNGGFGLIEHYEMPPGFASPYHTHELEDEAFYVLGGEMGFVLGGEWTTAGPGTFVFGPRGVAHGFRVEGTAPARILLLCSPGGFEKFVLELAGDPPSIPTMMAVAAKYGITIHGPLPERAGTAPQDNDAARIERIRDEHVAALNRGDAGAWASLFADDAVQMPPNFPANAGRAAIQRWAEGFLGQFRVSFALSVTALSIAGDQAVEHGGYTISGFANEQCVMQDGGKYITVYKRQPGGWAVSQDIWNSDQPHS